MNHVLPNARGQSAVRSRTGTPEPTPRKVGRATTGLFHFRTSGKNALEIGNVKWRLLPLNWGQIIGRHRLVQIRTDRDLPATPTVGGERARVVMIEPGKAHLESARKLGIAVIACYDSRTSDRVSIRNWAFAEDVLRPVTRLAEVVYFLDVQKHGELSRFVALVAPSARVLCCGGHDYLACALAADEAAGAGGDRMTSALRISLKDTSRFIANRLGKSSVSSCLVHSDEEARSFLRQRRGPCVLKPISGSDSRGVCLLKRDRDATAAMEGYRRDSIQPPYVIEDYIDGIEYSVDMLSHAGRHFPVLVFRKNPVLRPHFVENGGHTIKADSPTARRLCAYIKRFLDQAEYTQGPSHSELKIGSRGIQLIESQARFGGPVPLIAANCYGTDLHQEWLRSMVLAEPPHLVRKRELAGVLSIQTLQTGSIIAHVDASGARRDPFVCEFRYFLGAGQIVPVTTSNRTRHGWAFAVGKTRDEAADRIRRAAKKVTIAYHVP